MLNHERREREIQEFIVRHKLKAGKHNERAWGSYDLLMNFDPPTPYAFSGDTFGWGFTPEEAMIIFIGRCMDGPAFDENFVKFMGDARMFELNQIKFQVTKVEYIVPTTGSINLTTPLNDE